MALQPSGPIKMSEIKAELGSSSNSLRAYSLQAGFSAPDSLTEFLGYSALGSFSFAMWNGSVSVDLNGTVSFTTGNAASVSVSPTSFGLVSTNTTQTITVTVTVPSGYSNSGNTVTGTKTAVQPPKVFTYANWVSAGGTVSINRNTGNVSYANGTLGTVSSVSPTSFGLVTSSTSRNVTVNVTAPSGYANSGATVSGTYTATQAAVDETIAITLNGSHNTWYPSGQGESTTLAIDVVDAWNTAWTVQVSDTDWLSVVSATGTGDGTTTLVISPNYAGQPDYNGSARGGYVRVYKTSNSGIYDEVMLYQEVGVAPIVKPTVQLDPPTNPIIGWNEYGNPTVYKTYTGIWTGGSTPTQGSFVMNSSEFAFVGTDANVTVQQQSGFWIGTIADATLSPYTVGVYALNANSSTTTTKEATVTFTLSNTAGSNSATSRIRQAVAPAAFAFGDWNGSVSVSQGGSVSYVTGNAAAVSVSPTSFGLVNVDTSRTINVTVTVPGGYSNSGGTVSGTKTATQSAIATFSFGDAGASGFAVSQNGTITPPSVTNGTIASVTYNGSVANSYYSIVNTITQRSADVYVTVPSGYYNTGEQVGGTLYANQAATATFGFGDWYGNVSVDDTGIVSYTLGNASAVSVSPTSYGIVYTDTSRTVNVTVTVPSGYYNSGGTVSGTRTVTQPAAPASPTVTVYTQCNNSGIIYFIEGTYSYPKIEINGNCMYYTETTTKEQALASGFTEFFSIYESYCDC